LNRPLVQLLAGIVVFVVLGATSILVTNALFNVTASTRPSVTFSLVSDSSADLTPALPPTGSTAKAPTGRGALPR